MLKIYDVIVIFLIYGQYGAIRKLDSRHKKLTCKTCKTPVKLIFSLIVAFIKQKLKAELKNLKNTALILLL